MMRRGRSFGGVWGHPVPVAWVGDMQELYWLLGLKGARSLFPSHSHLVPNDKLDDVLGDYPVRTAAHTRQVSP